MEATQPSQKPQKTSSYTCHIYGLNGHRMIDYPKYDEMYKNGKYVTITKVQLVVEIQIVTANVNVVDVNVTIRNKSIEKHVFKDREPRKANNVID
jgi:hypothetical protein